MVTMFISSAHLNSKQERVRMWPLQSSDSTQQLRLCCQTVQGIQVLEAIGYIARVSTKSCKVALWCCVFFSVSKNAVSN